MTKRSQVLHPGPPPLTVQAAQAAIDVIDFMAATVRGVDLIDVTPEVRRRWQTYVASHYEMLPITDRQFLAAGDAMLATLKANWPRLAPQERELYRQQWSVTIGAALQFIQPVLDDPSAAAPQYGAAGAVGAYGSAPAAGGYSYASGDPMSSYITQIISGNDTKERQMYQDVLSQTGDKGQAAAMAQQVQSQNQAQYVQMLSNLSQMTYQSQMAVAKNFKY